MNLREGVLELLNEPDRRGNPRRTIAARDLRDLLAATEGKSCPTCG